MEIELEELVADEYMIRSDNSMKEYLIKSKQLCYCLISFRQYLMQLQATSNSSQYPSPFHYTICINFTQLLDTSDELAKILLNEPHFFKNILKETLYNCLNSTHRSAFGSGFSAPNQLALGNLIISIRIDLPAFPLSVVSRVQPLNRGLFIIRGLLIAVTTPFKYLISTLYHCPNKSCDNNENPVRVGVYDVEFSIDKATCSLCNSEMTQVLSGQYYEDQVVAVFIDPLSLQFYHYSTSASKRSQGTTVFFRGDLCKGLSVGGCYNVTVCYDYNMMYLTALGLHCTKAVRPQHSLTKSNEVCLQSDIPSSIQHLIEFLRFKCPQSPWALTTALSCCLAPNLSPVSCLLHLKAGILLSLASQDSNSEHPPVHLLCLESDDGRRTLNYCANKLAKRVTTVMAVENNVAGTSWFDNASSSVWLEGGPLLMAESGVCRLGEWSKFENNNSLGASQVKHALECGKVRLNGHSGHQLQPNTDPSSVVTYPLRCSLWAELHAKPNLLKTKNKLNLRTVTELFGMPFIGSCESDEEVKCWITERLSQARNKNKTKLAENDSERFLAQVSEDDLKQYLNAISSHSVTISQEASNLLRRYFVASRRSHPGCLPSSAIKNMIALSEAHARIELRREVTEHDIVYVIYLYEQSIKFIFGPVVTTFNLNLKEPTACSQTSIPEQVDDNLIKFAVWLESWLASVVNDDNQSSIFTEE